MKRETIFWTILFVAGGLFLLWRASTGAGGQYVRPVDGYLIGVPPHESLSAGASYSLPRTLGVWLAALFTLCIFSFLYRDNPLYRFAEAILVGVSAGYGMVVAFWTVFVPNVLANLAPDMTARWALPGTVGHVDWIYWVPLIMGVLLLWRLAPQGGWISRWPLAFIIGTTAGFRMIAYLEADFLNQINNTILPLIVMEDGRFDFWPSLRNLTIVLGLLAALVYFFFSVEHTGAVGHVARVGIWVLMITFGAAFGYTVMGRIALLSQRMEFLFDEWLWLIDPMARRLGL